MTDRVINLMAMKNTLASIWRPVKGVCIKELSSNLFLFQFFHELDMERVVKGGPWTFNQHLLIISHLKIGDSPNQVPLFSSEFWVQVHDLPCGFMSEKVGKEIGKFIGNYIEADANCFDGVWRNFMRIRVAIDVRKPLKKKMRIKKLGGEWAWICFKYEKMPTFCFFCGIIGHNERFCEKLFDCKEKPVEMPYGAWLRAPNRRGVNQVGERWLRQEAPATVEADTSMTVDRMHIERVDPCLQAKGKEISESRKVAADNCGSVDSILKEGREIRIGVNSNNNISEMVSLSQQAEVVIVDSKRRRMVDMQVNETSSSLGKETDLAVLNYGHSKNAEMAGLGFQACQDQ